MSPTGTIDVNVDAALFPDAGRMGISFVCGKHHGESLLSYNEWLAQLCDPEMAKAFAILGTVEACQAKGLLSINMVPNCRSIVDRIKS